MSTRAGRRLLQSVLVSLNGVTSEPLAWAGPYFGPAMAEHSLAVLKNCDALLMGRRTYEIFSKQWPNTPGDYAEQLNTMPKYVFSSTLQNPEWSNTTVISGDVTEAVSALKSQPGLDSQPGRDLILYGNGRFGQTLSNADLIDELTLTIVPVVVAGTTFYQADPVARSWELVAAAPGGDPGLASLTYRRPEQPPHDAAADGQLERTAR